MCMTYTDVFKRTLYLHMLTHLAYFKVCVCVQDRREEKKLKRSHQIIF